MISTSPATNRRDRRRAFTLPEVMMATVLTVVAVGGTLSTALMIMRSGYSISHYADMENESRRSLEQFGQDVRMASAIQWHDANSITITVPTNADGTVSESYTYTYDAVAKTFSRTSDGLTKVLVSGIEDCTIMGYQLNGQPTHDPSDTPVWEIVSNSTKQLQLSISSRRSQGNQIATTQKVISARFILRNKQVST